MELQQGTIITAIRRLSILHPQRGVKEGSSLEKVLVAEYYDSLKDVYTEHAFHMAFRIVKKKCKFFPSIADFVSAKEDVTQERNRQAENKPAQNKNLLTDTDNSTQSDVYDGFRDLNLMIFNAVKKGLPLNVADKAFQEVAKLKMKGKNPDDFDRSLITVN